MNDTAVTAAELLREPNDEEVAAYFSTMSPAVPDHIVVRPDASGKGKGIYATRRMGAGAKILSVPA